MSQSVDLHAIATRRVVYEIPGMADVTIRRDFTYAAADGSAQPIEIYYPPSFGPGDRLATVVIVTGYRDAGVVRVFGRPAKDIGTNVSWAQLIAASGMAAVTYVNTDPAADAALVAEHLRARADSLGLDSRRFGIWSTSGNGPTALSLLIGPVREHVRCAALVYACLLDLDGTTHVADMARTVGFANPTAGRTLADLQPGVPIFIARAGQDEMPGLNAALDRFVAHALAANLPITVVNHHTGPHAFDAVDDGDASRAIIRQILTFFRTHL